ncbi:8-oxo-dGTP diphosphatase [Actinoplanes italicus]|uniref:8-oxo-dGTP diphosphatase n=2 Tax=Actinoplanes italicus TaxID=113567 RepID=A0A2T0JX74_9ACTN|nr:8-oxo-dGTP diphosphatase [Actinoplanes italicus]
MIVDDTYSVPIRAAGALLWQGSERVREVVVVHRPRGDWSFPKGKVDPGEQLVSAVVREVREETGFRIQLGPWLGRTAYVKNGWPKQVDYFSGEVPADSGQVNTFIPSDEIDDVRWLPVPVAAGMLSRPDDVRLLTELEHRVMARSSTLILLQHGGMAGTKADWTGRKSERPLDESGLTAARGFGSMLAAYGPQVLHSADSLRCLQTVEPYASAKDLPVRDTKRLRGKHFDIDYALRIAGESLDTGESAVICAHTAGLEELFGELCRQRTATRPADTTIPKGGMVTLHGTAGKIHHIERHMVQ